MSKSETKCASNGRCFRMPRFVPFVFDPAADIRIGEQVFEDENANGVFDAGERVLHDVTVELHHVRGVETLLVARTLTDSAGKYSFSRYEDIVNGVAVVFEPDSNVFLRPA